MNGPRRITSSHNALLMRVRRLSSEPMAYRRLGQVWVEGEHLCEALLARSVQPQMAVVSEEAWAQPRLQALARRAGEVVCVPGAAFGAFSALPSPAGLGMLVAWSAPQQPLRALPTVVLDRVQDAGNVGSVLRNACALGFGQVIALKGTAGLWSPKVLRAGMGAQFGLSLHEGVGIDGLTELPVPLVCTSPRAARRLDAGSLPWPCAWVFGHEGQGVDEALRLRCSLDVRIPQPGGEESLNVAAAAAICLYESARGRQ
ncbi:MAG: TrmH family RNA methyltransferase [Rubrivivax sp.]